MELHLKISGVLLILLAVMHIGFPRYFKWGIELEKLSLINKQMMVTHAFFIALGLMLMGLLCITQSQEITHTPLGAKIALGLGVFWLLRLCVQFFGYSSMLWKGKRFETTIHIIFSIFWLYLSIVFLIIYYQL